MILWKASESMDQHHSSQLWPLQVPQHASLATMMAVTMTTMIIAMTEGSQSHMMIMMTTTMTAATSEEYQSHNMRLSWQQQPWWPWQLHNRGIQVTNRCLSSTLCNRKVWWGLGHNLWQPKWKSNEWWRSVSRGFRSIYVDYFIYLDWLHCLKQFNIGLW